MTKHKLLLRVRVYQPSPPPMTHPATFKDYLEALQGVARRVSVGKDLEDYLQALGLGGMKNYVEGQPWRTAR